MRHPWFVSWIWDWNLKYNSGVNDLFIIINYPISLMQCVQNRYLSLSSRCTFFVLKFLQRSHNLWIKCSRWIVKMHLWNKCLENRLSQCCNLDFINLLLMYSICDARPISRLKLTCLWYPVMSTLNQSNGHLIVTNIHDILLWWNFRF